MGARSLPTFARPADARGIALSAIAVMELWAGVRNEREARDLTTLTERARRRRRLVVPPMPAWSLAGQTIRALTRSGMGGARARAMRNDVLLAATATLLGARVLTANAGDFASIARVLPVHWSS